MKTFELSRNFWNWCYDNTELITPAHAAIYFFAIEHCNRLGGKEKFGFPSSMTMEAVGIRKHQTYIKYFNDLVDWGFFKLIQKSQNQYSANIISLVYALPEKDKPLDKAIIKHRAKQTESTRQSNGSGTDSIDKTIKQETNLTREQENRDFSHVFEIKTDKGEKISKLICTNMGITDMMPELVQRLTRYIAIRELRDQIDYFCEQVELFFKDTNRQYWGGLDTFLGDESLMAGRWNNPKTNGKEKITIDWDKV